MKKFRVELNEEELEALIKYHRSSDSWNSDKAKRVHDLTKKLKSDTAEISNDPRPEGLTEITGKDEW